MKVVNEVKKPFDHAKQSARDPLKFTSKRNSAEATGDLTDNKTSNKITKNSPQNNLQTGLETEEKFKKISKRYIHLQKKDSKTTNY